LTIIFPDALTDKDLALLESHPDVIEGSGTPAVSVDATMEAIEATDMLHEMSSSGLLNVELSGFTLFVTASSSAQGGSSSDPSGSTSSNNASGSLLPIIVGVVAGLLLIIVVVVLVRRRGRRHEKDRRTLAEATMSIPSSQAFHNPIFSAEVAGGSVDTDGHYYDVPGSGPDNGEALYSDLSFNGRGIVLNSDFGQSAADEDGVLENDGYLDVDADPEQYGESTTDGAAHYDAHPAPRKLEMYDNPRPFSTSGQEEFADVSVAEFHHGQLSRPEAERLLLSQNATDGLFLVRDSSSHEDAVAVSYTLRNKVRHYLLRKEGDVWLYDEKPVASAFVSMDEVVALLVSEGKHNLRAPLLVRGTIMDEYMTLSATSSRVRQNPMYTDVTPGEDC
jgi:hypothetical protein